MTKSRGVELEQKCQSCLSFEEKRSYSHNGIILHEARLVTRK
jgi:hypothetical protein